MSNISDDDLLFDPEVAATISADESTRRTLKLLFCVIYILLFIFGTFGNGYVIIMLAHVFRSLTSKTATAAQRMSAFGTTHMFVYVLALSVVDLLVLMHLPMLVYEMLEGQWIFGGSFTCKLYWMGESVNKLLSSFLMTVLSWDRYLAVCSPIKSIRFRNTKVALLVVFGCTLLAIVLLSPVISESTIIKLYKGTNIHVTEDRSPNDTLLVHTEEITKCIFDLDQYAAAFLLYTFCIGFVLPAILISYFYLKVILRLRASANSVRKHSDSFTTSSNSMARLSKVTHRVVAIVCFYFFCWIFYWSFNIMLYFQIIVASYSGLVQTSLFFAAHILVCFNSAANPILYALINRELRQQYNNTLAKRRRSMHLTANRVQSDKPSILRDTPSDFFFPQRRNQSYHQQRYSESSADSNVRMFAAAFAERCRASLPQTKLSKSLVGIRAMMTFGRTPPGTQRNSIAKRSEVRSSSFSQLPLAREESSFIGGSDQNLNDNQIKIFIQKCE